MIAVRRSHYPRVTGHRLRVTLCLRDDFESVPSRRGGCGRLVLSERTLGLVLDALAFTSWGHGVLGAKGKAGKRQQQIEMNLSGQY